MLESQVLETAPKHPMIMVRRYHSLMPLLYCTSIGMAHSTTTGVSFIGTPTIYGPGGAHSLGGSKLQHVGHPSAANDGATKAYVDAGDTAVLKKVEALKWDLQPPHFASENQGSHNLKYELHFTLADVVLLKTSFSFVAVPYKDVSNSSSGANFNAFAPGITIKLYNPAGALKITGFLYPMTHSGLMDESKPFSLKRNFKYLLMFDKAREFQSTASQSYSLSNIFSTDPGNATPILIEDSQGNYNVNNKRITNLAQPSVGKDAATKAYVDSGDAAVDAKVKTLTGSLNTKEATLLAAIASTNATLATKRGVSVPRYPYLESATPSAFPKFLITPYVPISGIYYLNTDDAGHNDIDKIWRTPGAGFLVQFFHDVCLQKLIIAFHMQTDNVGKRWDYSSTWQVFDPHGGNLSNPTALNKGYSDPPILEIPCNKLVATQAIFIMKTIADGTTLPNTVYGTKLNVATDIIEGIAFYTVAQANPPRWHST